MTLMLILAVSLLNSRAASAQEKGQTGLTMGYPASVGLVWQPSGSFALRPEFSFSTNSIDSDSSELRSATSLGVGLSGLLYVGRWESLSAYVSPRFVYNRLSNDGPTSLFPVTNTYSLTGSFGTQYAMNRRFGVFGEVGLGYSHADQQLQISGSPSTNPNPTTTTHSWGTRTGIGVLVYF
jgi:hypothetical protein